MSSKNTFEKMARNTWLAGLGSIESSIEVLTKSIDSAQEKSNHLYSEFLTRGEEIQGKISKATNDMEARGKELFGMNAKSSHEEKLATLDAKVEQLTVLVDTLLEDKKAKAAANKAAPKETSKAKPRAASKTTAKAATKATPAPRARKTVVKAVSKPAKTTSKTETEKK
jgi:type II secretory pathway component PulK